LTTQRTRKKEKGEQGDGGTYVQFENVGMEEILEGTSLAGGEKGKKTIGHSPAALIKN